MSITIVNIFSKSESGLSSLILGNVFGGVPKSFLLLILYSVLTLEGHASCFRISHTENVISLNSSINSAVSWDWLLKDLDFFSLWDFIDSEESGLCLFFSQTGRLFLDCSKSGIILFLSVCTFKLFIESISWCGRSIESVNLSRWNWLFKQK